MQIELSTLILNYFALVVFIMISLAIIENLLYYICVLNEEESHGDKDDQPED